MGFRLKRWWGASIGILPYSSVGYTVKTEKMADGSLQPYSVVFEGTGGINQFYLGNSLRIADKLSLGINISYLFGPLNQSETYYMNNESEYAVYTIRKYYLHRFYFDYGLQYGFKIKDLDYSLGLVFSNKQYLKSNYKTNMYTADGDSLTMESKKTENFIIPGKFGIGLAIRKDDKLQLAADYSFQYWSKSKSLSEAADLVNSQQINWGLEFFPNDKYKKNYLKHIKYRLGAYYNSSYLKLRKNQITKYGITFGFGLPIPRLKSFINLSFELGQRGTEANNLIKEKYGIIHLGFTLRETWFYRSKIE
jgi:hypothetical protein